MVFLGNVPRTLGANVRGVFCIASFVAATYFASRIAIGSVPRSDYDFFPWFPMVLGVKVLVINCLVFGGCTLHMVLFG